MGADVCVGFYASQNVLANLTSVTDQRKGQTAASALWNVYSFLRPLRRSKGSIRASRAPPADERSLLDAGCWRAGRS